MKDLSKHYGNLKPIERLQAALDAMARGDWAEADTLSAACPKLQYVAQRDLAYTGKYLDLQSIVLLHAAFFWKYRGTMLTAYLLHSLAPRGDTLAAYKRRRAELMTLIEAWQRFCAYAGFNPDTVTRAFGLELEPMLDDLPHCDTEPDQAMIDTLYQVHLRHWLS